MKLLAPAILLDGNIDAVRDLGRYGVPLVVCTGSQRHPAQASRHVSFRETAPSVWSSAFQPWFEALIERFPDAVVFSGSDSQAWWLDSWRLAHPDASTRLAIPRHEAFRTVTLKSRLHESCLTHGVATPVTWIARDEDAALAGLRDGLFPLVVKPQSRCGNVHWSQGQFVRDEAALRAAVRWALQNVRFRDEVTRDCPEIATPFVQEFVGGRDRPIYHIGGYLSAAGDWAALAHRKLLQFPRRFGSGLCFETAALDGELAERLVAMLIAIGFAGIFEAEFVERGSERLLIDLNPRCYNGMTLEIERGLNLPWYAYLEAIGETERLGAELRAARDRRDLPGLAWCRKLEFGAMLAGQSLGGGFTPRQTASWARWYWRNRRGMVDPFEAAEDRRVGRARLRYQVGLWRGAPRTFLGVYARRESSR